METVDGLVVCGAGLDGRGKISPLGMAHDRMRFCDCNIGYRGPKTNPIYNQYRAVGSAR